MGNVGTEYSAGQSSHAETETEDPSSMGGKIWASFREVLIVVGIALVISFLIKTFLFRAFVIPSGSMENTLQVNDRIFVNQLIPNMIDIKRGDIIVFQDEQGWLPPTEGSGNIISQSLEAVGLLPNSSEQHLVKRVIGLPGDSVTVDPESRNLVVNGLEISEPYLYPGADGSDSDFDVEVPEGKLWVLGDHRNASGDSRAHLDGPNGGFVDIDDVVGRAEVIAWPVSRWGAAGSDAGPFDHVPEPSR